MQFSSSHGLFVSCFTKQKSEANYASVSCILMCETLFHIEINSSGKLTFRKICSILDQYEMLHIDMNVCRILNEISQAGYALLIANDLHVLFFFSAENMYCCTRTHLNDVR